MGLRRVLVRTVQAAAWRRRLAALALLAACGAAALMRAPASTESHIVFPHASPAALADLLADFSTHPHGAESQPGSWRVEEERGNYTEWRYRVSFSCGLRCRGEARVHAAMVPVLGLGGEPHRDPASAHTVHLTLSACTHPPLLPWPSTCDEMEVEWSVSAHAAGGSMLEERARAWCGAVRVLLGVCARDLRNHRSTHLARLRVALPQLA